MLIHVKQDSAQARQQLAHAQRMSLQVMEEMRLYSLTAGSSKPVADAEQLRLIRESSKWINQEYAARHAIASIEEGTPGITGTSGAYRWLTSVDHDMDDLLRLCPEVFAGKCLAVTSIDGGTLEPTAQETRNGWRTRPDCKVFRGLPDGRRDDQEDSLVAFSPVLDSIAYLPNETHVEFADGFNEWLLFDGKAPESDMEVFVNWFDFLLFSPDSKWLLDRFWAQMGRLNVESYVAEGTVFSFATRDIKLFDAVLTAFSKDLESDPPDSNF